MLVKLLGIIKVHLVILINLVLGKVCMPSDTSFMTSKINFSSI